MAEQEILKVEMISIFDPLLMRLAQAGVLVKIKPVMNDAAGGSKQIKRCGRVTGEEIPAQSHLREGTLNPRTRKWTNATAWGQSKSS